MEDNSLTLKLISLLVIVSLVAVLVAVYHFITVSWCNRRRNPSRPPHHQQNHHDHELTDYSLENSVVLLIPAHKHQKVSRLDSKGREGDEAMCSICLCEFEENEELRTLPECLHSFHVACIDMWLCSHSTCPVCRADAVPTTQILFQILDSESQDMVVRPEQPSNIV